MVTGRKLLLADDSVTIQKVVDLTFSDEGLEVITASDGQQALDKLEESAPDIVLADVHMPQLNGYELCELIKQDERFRHIPVMLLVGSFEPFDEAEARRVGADDYLTKPFQSIRTLIGKVGHLLSGEKGMDEATTRKLTPPPEAEQANRSDPEFLERSTADTVPLPDVDDEPTPAVPSRDVSFADLSMDDEMIETSPASEFQAIEPSLQSRTTMQYSLADLHETGVEQVSENSTAAEEEVIAATPAAEAEPEPAFAVGAAGADNIASSDDALLDLGDLEPSGAMQEADDFFLDLLDDTPAPSRPSASFGEAPAQSFSYEQPAITSTEASHSAAAIEEPSAPESENFFDSAPSAQHSVFETPALEPQADREVDSEFPPTQRLPEGYQIESAGDAFDGEESQYAGLVEAVPPTGPITLEQISPEVIDAIARRAVEQLSERQIEQIAWEVVPDLAERLIRRRMEEEKL